MIEEELKKFEIAIAKRLAKEEIISKSAVKVLNYRASPYSFLDETLDCLLEIVETRPHFTIKLRGLFPMAILLDRNSLKLKNLTN